MRKPLFLAGLTIAFAACPGCGYTIGSRSTQQRNATGEVPSVAVKPFDNVTYRRGLEITLTRLVDDELRVRTPGIPRDPDTAEWIMTGSVVAAYEQVLADDRDDVAREKNFVMTVRVTLTDRTTERVLRTYSVTESEPFSPRAGRVATLRQAEAQVLRDIAERVVYGLEGGTPGK